LTIINNRQAAISDYGNVIGY